METAPYYKLIGHEVVPEHDEDAYAKWWRAANRTVASTKLHGYLVSTVFVGLGRLWFETLVEDGTFEDLWSGHAWNWEEASARHQEAIEYVETELVA